MWDISVIMGAKGGCFNMKERAERIHKLIIESGKSYQELEKLTGIKKSSLQRYASGVTGKIPLTAIEKLASAFSVSEAYIMWGEGKQKQSAVSELSNQKKELIEKVMQMSDEELQKLDMLLRIVESK